MFFVYIGSVNEKTRCYDVHIYDTEHELFFVDARLQSDNIQAIENFLTNYYSTLKDDTLKIRLKIESKEQDKFVKLPEILNLYKAPAILHSSQSEHQSVRNFDDTELPPSASRARFVS